jgi:hypothetical protein
VAPFSWQESQAAPTQFGSQRLLPPQVGLFIQSLAERVACRDEATAIDTVPTVQCTQLLAPDVNPQNQRVFAAAFPPLLDDLHYIVCGPIGSFKIEVGHGH